MFNFIPLHLHRSSNSCPYNTGDPLHSRALAHSRAPLFTQPCPHCSHSRAPGEQWARLCVFTSQGCVQAAWLYRGSPVYNWTFLYSINRADSRLAPSQWDTSLQSNAVSHWLGTNLESTLIIVRPVNKSVYMTMVWPSILDDLSSIYSVAILQEIIWYS